MDNRFFLLGLSLLLFLSNFPLLSSPTALANQSQFFSRFRNTVSGSSLQKWDVGRSENYSSSALHCKFDGVTCNENGSVVGIDVSHWSLSGEFPSDICSYLPELRTLSIGDNRFTGSFLAGICTNCSHLEILDMNRNLFTGSLPDFSSLRSLRVLDLSWNHFSGRFPTSITNLTEIETLNFNENPDFDPWELPEGLFRLTKLRTLILSTCGVTGRIPAGFGRMTWLEDLELSGNGLVGRIPTDLGRMKSLRLLELYYNQLSGEIPEELGNLTKLEDLDISVNDLTGTIPESLCRLPSLATLHLYNNSLSGTVPQTLGNSTTLKSLSLYENFFSGQLPQNLGEFSGLEVIDVSENRFSGSLPPNICKGGKLMYFLVLDNQFTGELPESYAGCTSLLRFRVSNNRLSGRVPGQLWGLPRVSIIDLGSNDFEGSMSPNIEYARNLSELYVEGNQFSAEVPKEINGASQLIKLVLSRNQFSGPLPIEIGELRMLNVLQIQENRFVGPIPYSLSLLRSINLLNLSNNQFSGSIPESICSLLPSTLDLSNNQLSGPVPPIMIKEGLSNSLNGNPDLCIRGHIGAGYSGFPFCASHIKRQKLNSIWVIGVSLMAVFLGLLSLFKRWFSKDSLMAEDGASTDSLNSWDIKCFHKLKFNVHEILEALDPKNVIGHGGSGTVYRVQLGSGELVAVKKFWTRRTKYPTSDQYYLDMELKAEVETLGSIRHKNIVKLYCCFSNPDSNMLVYEYMPNGNLWDALHQAGKGSLDWPARHKIAVGVAQGLAYLHHDSLPSIIHRDIKSTNILLDADFQPKVADFGVAKVLQAQGVADSTSVIAGTYGYLAPEYAYSSKATVKCDVYSFGVVLMELITGRKPLEPEFGENKNIVFWVSCNALSREGADGVLDKRISGSFNDEMIQALRVAVRCTCSSPTLRPTMSEVAAMLLEADPFASSASKSVTKTKNLR